MPLIATKTQADLITHEDFNTLHDTIASVLGTTINGYGTNILSTSSTGVMLIQAQMVADLYDDVDRCRRHQTNVSLTATIARPELGAVISATFFNNLVDAVQAASDQRFLVAPEQLTTYSTSSFVVTNNWSSPVGNAVVVDWNSADETRWHFNLGGYLTSSLATAGPATTAADADMVYVLSLADANFRSFKYDRDRWLIGSTSSSVTVTTSTGVYTATVNYGVLAADQVDAVVAIYPPSGANLTVDVLTTTTVYYSWDAILAPPLKSFEILKLLQVDPPQVNISLKAGGRSAAVPVTLSNLGMEPITVSDIVLTANGADAYFVASINDPQLDYPEVVPFNYPLVIPPSSQIVGKLYYSEPVVATTKVGVFNNTLSVVSDSDWGTLTVNVTVNIEYPNYAFDLIPVNYNSYFEFTDWQNEFNLTNAQRDLGIAIANRYFYPNTDFGVQPDGVRRYALFRRPTAAELVYWVNWVNTNAGGDINLMAPALASYVDSVSVGLNRSRTSAKNFDPGWGYGRFYDRVVGDFEITTGGLRSYNYQINDRFGQRISYASTLTNYSYSAGPGNLIQGAYNISNGPNGPTITFNPNKLPATGTCVADLVVTSTAIDLNGATVSVTNTSTLSLEVTAIVDQHYISWVSAQNRDNGVIGISYDRIDGQPCLTVGVGMGSDGANNLVNGGSSYISVDNLGVNGDTAWGMGFPLYKINYPDWGSFMNIYGVWPSNPTTPPSRPYGVMLTRTYFFTAPNNGYYDWQYSVDDQGAFYIDDLLQTTVSGNFKTSTTGSIYLSAGIHSVTFSVLNNSNNSSGNPGGIAICITNRTTARTTWSTLFPVRSKPVYQYWVEVYRIPMRDHVAGTYYLKDHVVKTSYQADGKPYGVYFGDRGTPSFGSMMSVQHDGLGNLVFTFNPANSFPNDESAAYTISGLQFAKFYYSDRGNRLNNLESKLSGETTHMLYGMTHQDLLLSVVPVPYEGLYTEFVPSDNTPYDGVNDAGGGGGWAPDSSPDSGPEATSGWGYADPLGDPVDSVDAAAAALAESVAAAADAAAAAAVAAAAEAVDSAVDAAAAALAEAVSAAIAADAANAVAAEAAVAAAAEALAAATEAAIAADAAAAAEAAAAAADAAAAAEAAAAESSAAAESAAAEAAANAAADAAAESSAAADAAAESAASAADSSASSSADGPGEGSSGEGGGEGGKIVCTAMNRSYGFGSFRQTIWLKHSENFDPAYERGYHAIFLPLVNYAYTDGTPSRGQRIVRNILEHIARHRTADLWKQRRGKRDKLGMIYRVILEPICYLVGKLKK